MGNFTSSMNHESKLVGFVDEILIEIISKIKTGDVLLDVKNINSFGRTNKRFLELSKTMKFSVTLPYGLENVSIPFVRDVYKDSREFVKITSNEQIIIDWESEKCNFLNYKSNILDIRRAGDSFVMSCDNHITARLIEKKNL